MKKRLLFYIPVVFFIITLTIGSISNFDLTINSAIYDVDNLFGVTMAAFSLFVAYGFMAFYGGVFFITSLNNKELKLPVKILFYILSVGCLGVAVYYGGGGVFSVNGFYNPELKWLGYVIALPVMVGCSVWGVFEGKKNNDPKLWVSMLTVLIVSFIVLVPAVIVLKDVFHRPRFRYVVNGGLVNFHNWWQPCSEYKTYIGQVANGMSITKEEFKSFPSGHTSTSALTMMFVYFLSLINPKLKKHQLWMFYVAFAWTLLVAFSRMLVGAHFLTDVSMGGLIFSIFFVIGNEVYELIMSKVNAPKVEIE